MVSHKAMDVLTRRKRIEGGLKHRLLEQQSCYEESGTHEVASTFSLHRSQQRGVSGVQL